MVGGVGCEFGEGLLGEVEGGEEGVGFCEERGDFGGGERVGDDEVAVGVEGGDLGGGEAGGRGWRRRDAGGCHGGGVWGLAVRKYRICVDDDGSGSCIGRDGGRTYGEVL